METIRLLLEEIQKLDNMRREAQSPPLKKPMTLYPPASSNVVNTFLNEGWTHPLPPSFGNFLAASDGVDHFRGQLNFVSTDRVRQEPIRSVIKRKIGDDEIDLRALFEQVDNTVIERYESNPKKFYVANHPVVAVSNMGALLFYDSRTRDSKGEMQLCWRSAAKASIEKSYDNIQSYLEAALLELKEKT